MAVSPEFRETRLRLILTLCVTVGMGAVYAVLLIFGLRTTYVPVPSRAPVRVAFASAAGPAKPAAAAASSERARLPVNVPSKLRKPKQKPRRRSDAPAHVDGLQEVTAAAAPASAPDARPAPPAPPDEYAQLQGRAYPEIPGGPVMVLALLLDSTGTVQNARVMVPSNNAAGDLTYLMTVLGQRVPVPEPAIAPGETRWIELRFRYDSDAVLP